MLFSSGFHFRLEIDSFIRKYCCCHTQVKLPLLLKMLPLGYSFYSFYFDLNSISYFLINFAVIHKRKGSKRKKENDCQTIIFSDNCALLVLCKDNLYFLFFFFGNNRVSKLFYLGKLLKPN